MALPPNIGDTSYIPGHGPIVPLPDTEDQTYRFAMMADQRSDYFTLERLLSVVTYKPGVSVRAKPPEPGSAYMHGVGSIIIEATVPSSYDPLNLISVGRSIDVPPYLIEQATENRDRFYKWLFSQLMSYEKHEAQEWFKVGGVMFDDPHH